MRLARPRRHEQTEPGPGAGAGERLASQGIPAEQEPLCERDEGRPRCGSHALIREQPEGDVPRINGREREGSGSLPGEDPVPHLDLGDDASPAGRVQDRGEPRLAVDEDQIARREPA